MLIKPGKCFLLIQFGVIHFLKNSESPWNYLSEWVQFLVKSAAVPELAHLCIQYKCTYNTFLLCPFYPVVHPIHATPSTYVLPFSSSGIHGTIHSVNCALHYVNGPSHTLMGHALMGLLLRCPIEYVYTPTNPQDYTLPRLETIAITDRAVIDDAHSSFTCTSYCYGIEIVSRN